MYKLIQCLYLCISKRFLRILSFAIDVNDWSESTHDFLFLVVVQNPLFIVSNEFAEIESKGTELIYAPNIHSDSKLASFVVILTSKWHLRRYFDNFQDLQQYEIFKNKFFLMFHPLFT